MPRDEGGPVFAEPWQAQAFALAVRLSEQGHYTWKEWAAALADELQAAAGRGEPDDGSRYYEHWLAALESLVAAKGLADPTALAGSKRSLGRCLPEHASRPAGGAAAIAGARNALASAWPRRARSRPGGCFSTRGWSRSGERVIWTGWNAASGGSALPLGFAASAGLGTLLGMRHALEPDHLAAVSTLMTGERSSAKAAWLGACWGLGHTLTLLTAGAPSRGVADGDAGDRGADAGALRGPAAGRLWRARDLSGRLPGARGADAFPSTTRSSSPFQVDRWTLARPLLVGAVHGLAGSGALTAIVVTTLPSTVTRLGYLLLFGVGSTVGMAALSGLLGWPIARLGAHRVFARTVSLAVGCVSTALGLVWGYPFIEGLF